MLIFCGQVRFFQTAFFFFFFEFCVWWDLNLNCWYIILKNLNITSKRMKWRMIPSVLMKVVKDRERGGTRGSFILRPASLFRGLRQGKQLMVPFFCFELSPIKSNQNPNTKKLKEKIQINEVTIPSSFPLPYCLLEIDRKQVRGGDFCWSPLSVSPPPSWWSIENFSVGVGRQRRWWPLKGMLEVYVANIVVGRRKEEKGGHE